MTDVNGVDVMKMDAKEKLAYLYGVSVTKTEYETFIHELIQRLIYSDPEQLNEFVNELRTEFIPKPVAPSHRNI